MTDYFPLISAVVIGASIASLLWAHPRVLVAFALLTVLFLRTFVQISGLTAASFLDDGLVALCILRGISAWASRKLAARRSIAQPSGVGQAAYPGLAFFAIFAVFGIASSVWHGLEISTSTSGAFLALKGILFGWSVAQFEWDPGSIRRGIKISAGVLTLILFMALINAAMPGPWARVFAVHGEVNTRYGLPSLTGPFIHPFDLAFASSLGAVAALSFYDRIRQAMPALWLFLLSSGATFLSFRRKDLIGLIVAALVLSLRFRRWGWVGAAGLALPIATIIGWEEIAGQLDSLSNSYFAVSSGEARTVLTLGAIQIGGEYFPLGAGFGRYGSRTAAVNYSPEYVRLGFTTVYGLEPGPNGGLFLTDTSWPAVIGEAGYIGAVAFVLGLLVILKRIINWELSSNSPELKFVGACALAWFVLTVFQSTGAAVFSSPPMYPFLFGLIGIGVALQRRDNDLFSPLRLIDIRK